DLVRINNDRVVGYKKAVDETEDVDLNAIFTKMANDSQGYVNELSKYILNSGGEVTTSTTTVGKFYRVWMDIQTAVTGKDRSNILSQCEFGEDAAQEAYEMALESDAEMSSEVRQLLVTQKASLLQAHDTIKKMRDIAKKVS
ncbi:MAG: PA2169 family four-helix-bundle protein, partial [Verrucomicrobia bacterium]|nr:PA2169 family four-helix-bundle protein [Cytophagales bacterium]